jgi:hypothetical protein
MNISVFKNNSTPFYKGLKATTKTITINNIVGISFIILKNFDEFLLLFNENKLKCLPK